MARTGLNQINLNPSVNCGDPRTTEADDWGKMRDNAIARAQRGIHCVGVYARYGNDSRVNPCVGTGKTVVKDFIMRQYYWFEQPNLKPIDAAVTSDDKIYLYIKFSINNIDVGSGNIRGKVRVSLINTGGQLIIYEAREDSDASSGSSPLIPEETFDADLQPNDWTEQEKEIDVTLPSNFITAAGTTQNAQLLVEWFDVLSNDIGSGPYDLETIASAVPYVGIHSVYMKLYNPAT